MNNSQEELDLITECPEGGLHDFLPVFNNGKRLLGRYYCSKCGWKHTKQRERQSIWDAEIEEYRKKIEEKSALNILKRLFRINKEIRELNYIEKRLNAI